MENLLGKNQFDNQNLKPSGISGSAHLLCCGAIEVVKIHLHAPRLEYEPIRKSQNLGAIQSKIIDPFKLAVNLVNRRQKQETMTPKEKKAFIKDVLEKAFEKKGAGFMKLSELKGFISPDDKKKLNLKSNPTNADLINILELNKPVKPYSKNPKENGKAEFLFNVDRKKLIEVEKNNLKNFIFNNLDEKNSITFGNIYKRLPITKSEAKRLINQMVDENLIKIKISKSDLPELFPSKNPVAAAPIHVVRKEEEIFLPKTFQEKLKLFKNAYDQLGKGKLLVYIHEIRKRLSWPGVVFDPFLDELMVEGYVKAHVGEMNQLTPEQVKNSFMDEIGTIYSFISWRKSI